MSITLWQGGYHAIHPTGPRWVNILGNLPGQVTELTSRLNGGTWRNHWVGPDLRRLTDPGDFNIELPRQALRPGRNRVEIAARNSAGNSARAEVILDLRQDRVWSLPHCVDWQDTGSFEISDGLWRERDGAIRTAAPGYDRMICFGDDGWKSYDLTTQVTFHAASEPLASAPTFGVSHVALAAHWPGHGADMHDPHLAWYPLGVTCEWQVNPRLENCRFRMLFGGDRKVEEPGSGRQLRFGQPYALRLRVETSGNRSRYAIRAWQAGEAEPMRWALAADKPFEDVPSGAAALLAHNTDVSFGKTRIMPI